tara:strand:- start:309 stop:572 length:264 start_codon:yes stop_codon:yes gene_type:complete
MDKSIRRRMNITVSVKGVKTWDTTVDATGYTIAELAEELDQQVKILEVMVMPQEDPPEGAPLPEEPESPAGSAAGSGDHVAPDDVPW